MDTAFASTMIIALASLASVALLTQAGLRGFLAWVELKRASLPISVEQAVSVERGPTQVGNRIDLADLKERMRRLEAIAAGVEL